MPEMSEPFPLDLFLSHSSQDKAVVRALAERLRGDGLRVWFDEWAIQPGDSIPAKIEEGLEDSLVLVLCMSAAAFGSNWAQLEAGTFRFRDPLNKERRFIPLRLDDTPIKGSLEQISYIDWRPTVRAQAYAKLLEVCRPPVKPSVVEPETAGGHVGEWVIQIDSESYILNCAFSLDGRRAILATNDNRARLWNVETGRCLRVLSGHMELIQALAWSGDQHRALSGSNDTTIRLWDVETGRCLRTLKDHDDIVLSVAWSGDQRRALSGSIDQTVRLWDIETGRCLRIFKGHTGWVMSVAWSSDGQRALSGSRDQTIRLWDVETGRCLRTFKSEDGGEVCSVAWNSDQRRALSGSNDGAVRLWDVETGRCLRVLEGHTNRVASVVWSTDGRLALSGSDDKTVRLWEIETGRCLRVLKGHADPVLNVVWGDDGRRAFSGGAEGCILAWDLSEFVTEAHDSEAPTCAPSLPPNQVQYTNAKVVLVGDTSAGKTGLSMRLAHSRWEPSDSTVGAWATQWNLPVASGEGGEREIWLWDFGGQADQQLIHHLYLDETALAVLVFDGQKENLFETLGQRDRALTRASRKGFAKLLVAGRVDTGGLRVSQNQIETFAKERGYTQFLKTSAKTNLGCEALKEAILKNISWEDIPWRSSPLLFKQLKEEIIRLKDEGRVLIRFNDLRGYLQLSSSAAFKHFTDEELKAVLGLLAGPGVVWELEFGSWVLLQPEYINAYAQAVLQTIRADEEERGYLPEARVLNGDLTYHSSMKRLETDDERFVLLAMHQMLLSRGLCLREETEQGACLIFPSYYRRERPELVGHPAVWVSYRFNGFLDEIYATLVVRLHHALPFQRDHLWHNAADFKTLTGKQVGVKMTRRAEGAGELAVYFDPVVSEGEKVVFSKYVHEHLQRHASDVERLRHYVCPQCGTLVGNLDVAMKRRNAWLEGRPPPKPKATDLKSPNGREGSPTIICAECEQRVPLWDEIEQHFASPAIQQQVRVLQEASNLVLDNESKERALVGEVISTVALAGQISREFSVSDHGIDMEIEFKDDSLKATGKKLYLQLKSGDSHLRKRKGDGTEVFTIKDERHARYWMGQAFPVMLVIRTSDGDIRWMEVRDRLKEKSGDSKTPVKQIIFSGERFDVMSVRRWREKALSKDASS